MKFPSISYLLKNAKRTFLRFPLMLLSAILAVSVGIYAIECREEITNPFPFVNLVLAASIGIPLYFSASIAATKNNFSKKITALSNVLVTIILVLIFTSLPNKASTHNINQPYIKFAIYIIAAHLLTSVIPFINNKHQINGFWQYNRILFIRIITSAIFSSALSAGLSIAITAINQLFDIKLHFELYFECMIIVWGVFNTWFFANGIPDNFDALEEIDEYPKGLKIFSQYILLPLLGLYLIILYLYGAKILIEWNWPKGIVSYLIICISVLGILAFLLLYPFGKIKESSWIKKAETIFYISLIPLLFILFFAIFMRIDDYGITINRYFILALGIWLCIVAVFSLLFKTNIKFIPLSLAAIILLSSFGPWGVFSVSENYQVKRLQSILEKNNIIVNGKIANERQWSNESSSRFNSTQPFLNNNKMNDSLRNEVRSILDYLDEYHGFTKINGWFTQNINQRIDEEIKLRKNAQSVNEAAVYMKSMGLNYESSRGFAENPIAYYNVKSDQQPLMINGYDYEIEFSKNIYNDSFSTLANFQINSTNCSLSFKNDNTLDLTFQLGKDSINIPLRNLIQQLGSQYGENGNSDLPPSAMSLAAENTTLRLKIMIQSLDVQRNNNQLQLNAISGKLLIDMK